MGDEHWEMLLQHMEREDVDYDLVVGDVPEVESYDTHCELITGGCVPTTIVSADRLCEEATGPTENRKIAQALLNKQGYEALIPEDGWECIWRELLIQKKGMKTFVDREHDRPAGLYNFSEEFLSAMIAELDRLIKKYVVIPGDLNEILVTILREDQRNIQEELDDLLAGRRKLKVNDFLGPKARAKRKLEIEEEKLYWSEKEKEESEVEEEESEVEKEDLTTENTKDEEYW